MKLPRIPLLSSLSLLLLVSLIVLWYRAGHRSEVVRLCGWSGNWHGVASDRKGILLVTSDLPGGPEVALTADAGSVDAAEFAELHDTFLGPNIEKWKFLGFHYGTGTNAEWQCKFKALLVPYWALIVPLAILPFRSFRRGVVWFLRRRRGQCLNCGYDLRQTPERCPECGSPVRPDGTKRLSGRPLRASALRAVPWLLAGVLVGAVGDLFWRGRDAAAHSPRDPESVGRRIAQLSWSGNSLPDAFRRISSASGARIDFQSNDPDSTLPERTKTPFRLHLRDVTASAAIRGAMWESPGHPSFIDRETWATGDATIQLKPRAEAPVVARAYSVADLLEVLSTPPPAFGPNSLFTGQSVGVDRGEYLIDIVLSATDPERLRNNAIGSGPEPSMGVVGDYLIVRQTPESHVRIRTLLADLRLTSCDANPPPAEGRPPADDHANVEQGINELKLESATLESAIDTVRETTRSNIVVNWDDLSVVGVSRSTPVRLHLWNVTVDKALNAIFAVAGKEGNIAYEVRDNIIQIETTARLHGTDAIRLTKLYDVRDLIDQTIEYYRSHPPTTAPSNQTASTTGDVASNGITSEEAVEVLVKLLEDEVAADSWKDNGGADGSVREFNGRLIITQTPENHRKIVTALSTLRSGGSKEGTDLFGSK